MHGKMEASIKVNISDVLCPVQFYLQVEHNVFTALPLYIVNHSHSPKLLLISCRDQEEFFFFYITWLLSFLALFFCLCTCFWYIKCWPQLERGREDWFWQDKMQFQVLLRKCWKVAGVLRSFSQSSEHNRQKRKFFAAKSESVCSFQHGTGIVIVYLPVFQFLVLSSRLLLSQEAQMFVALGCPLSSSWASSRVCGFLAPAVICCFLWDMLCPVLCRGTFSGWAPLPAGFRRHLLTYWQSYALHLPILV